MRIFFLLLLSGLGFFPGCQSTDDLNLDPTIRFSRLPEGSFVLDSDTVVFQFQLTALDGIASLRIREKANGVLLDLGNQDFPPDPVSELEFALVLDSFALRDTLEIEIQLTDLKGRITSGKDQFILAAALDTFSLFLSQNQDSLPGAYLNLFSVKTYTLTEAGNASDSVDLGQFRDSLLGWIMFSPSDPFAKNSLVPELGSWPNRKMSSVNLVEADRSFFEGLRTDGPLLGNPIHPDSMMIKGLVQGDVVGIQTEEGVLAWLLLDAIQNADSLTMGVHWKIKRQKLP